MKNLFTKIFSLLCLLMLFSCSVNDSEISERDNYTLSEQSKFKINKVLEIIDRNEKRIAYGLLDKEESCRASKCTVTTTGCGFGWAWECNGKCQVL